MVKTDTVSVPRRTMLVVLAAGYVFFAATYLPINHASVGREAHRLFLPGEERLPLVPAAELPYLTGYFFPLLLLWRPPHPRDLPRLVVAFGLVLAVAYTTYAVCPVYLERPPLVPDSLATRLLAVEYLDPPYNHFPSLHVALGTLVFLAVRGDAGRARRPLAALLAAMCVSTVFVKQHYVVDVLYGAALAPLAWGAAGRWSSPRSEGERDDAIPFRKALR